MGKKLSGLKYIVWALAIAVGLITLLVGFVIAATSKYSGEGLSGRIELGAGDEPAAASYELSDSPADGTLHELAKTKDLGQDYIDGLTFLCDTSLIGIRDYGVLADGIQTTQVWSTATGEIPVDSLSTCAIKYPQDGSNITAAEAAMIRKPSTLIVSLGLDGLAGIDRDGFISSYSALIRSIQSASPSTHIVCCALSSITPTYMGGDGLTAERIADANDWIRDVCIETGVYYADITHDINSSGYLTAEYATASGKGLNSAGLDEVLKYLRKHAI